MSRTCAVLWLNGSRETINPEDLMRPGLMSQVHFLSDAKSHHASFFMYKNEIKLPAYSVKKKKKKEKLRRIMM